MSRKRSKADSGFSQDDVSSPMVGSLPELHGGSMAAPVPSYASLLRNRTVDSMDDVDLELSDADCCFSSGMEGEGLCFSEHAREVLERPWKSAVVVRLMGKANSVCSFDFMLRNLRRKWRSNGAWKLVDLLNDWFIVKFELEEDMEAVLCEGPWIIAGQTLIVKRWSAGFDPVQDSVGSMPVWVRIVGLPVLYFADYAMKKIGQLLGEVVKVDVVTLGQERGRFARVCVEMDLSKPFKSSVMVDKVCYKVQYEGLSLLCFSCGVYGHTKEKCPSVCSSVAPVAEDKSVAEDSAAVGGEGDSGMGLAMGNSSSEDGVFGPWMLVNYRNRKKNVMGKAGELSAQGSRFSVLQGEGAEEVQVGTMEDDVVCEVSGTREEAPGEASRVWTFLQNKIKEGHGGATVLDMENTSGAYILPVEKKSSVSGGAILNPAPRIPLADLSIGGRVKSKGM